MEKRFRVAFSFAGESRAFVSETARLLSNVLGQERVLYDKFYEAEFARPELGLVLPLLYRNEADLIVVILCEDYEKKSWCGLEWRAVLSLIKSGCPESTMLCRFGFIEPPNLLGLAGYVDLDTKTPQQLTNLILERLDIAQRGPQQLQTVVQDEPTGWPDSAPTLSWPMADHRNAQTAFSDLIVDDAHTRILPICGHRDTGKSHLTRQLLKNALGMNLLRAGRFDFKGCSDISQEVRTFAEQLDVPCPPSDCDASIQLGQVLSFLKQKAEPTLLIFDTFESASSAAENWMIRGLLISVVRHRWLRVVVVGQRTVSPFGEPWAGHSFRPIELGTPTLDDWLEYCRFYNLDLDRELLARMHEHCRGSSSALAQFIRSGIQS